MNNMQLYLTIGVPSFLVILSWISNKSDIASLRAEIGTLRSEMRSEISNLRSEIGTLRTEMNGLGREIYEALIPLHERMAVIEVKQK